MATRRHGRGAGLVLIALVASCGGPDGSATKTEPATAPASLESLEKSAPPIPTPTGPLPNEAGEAPPRAPPTGAPTTPAEASPPAASDPPAVNPLELLDRCQTGTSRELRAAACRELLELPGLQDAGDPNLVSERADAIRELYELRSRTPLTPELRRALGSSPRTCVVVHPATSAGVVSLMCRMAVCGEPSRWVPYDLEVASGTLRGQQC